MNIRELFKSKYFLFIFGCILELIIYYGLICGFLNDPDSIMDISVDIIVGLLLGPYASLGMGLGYFITEMDVFTFNNFLSSFINSLFFSFIGIIIWKLWYTALGKYGYNVPKLNSTYSFIKLNIISIIIGALVLFIIMLNNPHSTSLIIKYFRVFILAIILLIFILPLYNLLNLPQYTPKIQFKQRFPLKIYNLCGIAIFILIPLIRMSHINYTIQTILIALVLLLFGIIFFIKPYPKEVMNIKENKIIPVTEKATFSLIQVIFFITIIELIIIFITPPIITNPRKIANITAIFMVSVILIYLIPMFIYLYYLEKNITEPINKLSIIASNIYKNKSFNETKEKILEIKGENEINILSKHMIELTDNIQEYSENLKNTISEKEKYKTELELADKIQSSMIPVNFREFTKNKNIELWGQMTPAKEVGGDFYDFFEIDEENIGFTIGDVSGKGIPAALFMVKTMTIIEDYLKNNDDLVASYEKINNQLCEGNEEELFVTNWMGKLNTKTGELSFVNAGHNQPLIKEKDSFQYLDTKPGLVLAGMEDMIYKENTIKLKPGNIVFLYTDGVTEANDNYQEFYGEKRLKDILNKNVDKSLEEIIKIVYDDIREFSNNQEQFDDITMFILKYN